MAFATGNFVPVNLPKGVKVELPRNWKTLSTNKLITLDSYVQAKGELAGELAPPSDLSFAANYYDDQGKIAAMFNIRYYPEETLTQTDIRALTTADIKELDEGLHNEFLRTQHLFGIQLLSWLGTKKETINGTLTFVIEYRRAPVREGAPFRVRLVRVMNAERSFTVTVSYREDREPLLRPICDRVIQSIQIRRK